MTAPTTCGTPWCALEPGHPGIHSRIRKPTREEPMTGPEHYEEAARLVEASKRHTDQGDAALPADQIAVVTARDDQIAVLTAMQASMHAKLAAVASYVEADVSSGLMTSEAGARWRKAIGHTS